MAELSKPQYYIQLNGVEEGPMTAKTLHSLAEAGRISPNTLIRKEGKPKTVPAGRIKGLFKQPENQSGFNSYPNGHIYVSPLEPEDAPQAIIKNHGPRHNEAAIKRIVALFNIFGIPFTILNMLGGVFSGIWLGILGDWASIGYGILVVIVSRFALGIALMPSLLISSSAAQLPERKEMDVLYTLGFLTSLYVVVVITVWCGAVLYLFAARITYDSEIPILIWSYGVALAPLQWMAQKDAQNGSSMASMVITFCAQVGYVVMILLSIFLGVTFIVALAAFVIIMVLGIILNLVLVSQLMKMDQDLLSDNSD